MRGLIWKSKLRQLSVKLSKCKIHSLILHQNLSKLKLLFNPHLMKQWSPNLMKCWRKCLIYWLKVSLILNHSLKNLYMIKVEDLLIKTCKQKISLKIHPKSQKTSKNLISLDQMMKPLIKKNLKRVKSNLLITNWMLQMKKFLILRILSKVSPKTWQLRTLHQHQMDSKTKKPNKLSQQINHNNPNLLHLMNFQPLSINVLRIQGAPQRKKRRSSCSNF